MLINNYSIKKYDNTLKYVLTTNQGHFYINKSTKELIAILAAEDTIEEALVKFNETFNSELSKENFLRFLKDRLKGLGLLKEDTKIIKTNAFVKNKIKLIPANIASVIASPFSYFFKVTYFWYLLALLSIICAAIVIKYIGIYNLNSPFENITQLVLLALPVVLFHELGHVAACKPAGIKNGEIGIGIYLIFPVFYSDISNLWTATKQQRIIANLAGVFNQFLYSVIMYGIFYFTGYEIFLTISILIIIDGVYQLYPFVRSDGYWVLSDALSIPNLQQKGRTYLTAIFTGRWNKIQVKNKEEIFVLSYSIINLSFILFYVYFLVFKKWDSFILFPKTLFTLLKDILSFNWNDVSISPLLFLHGIIYFTLGKYVLRFINSKIIKTGKPVKA